MCGLCDAYDEPDNIPNGHVLCPRCDGHQTIICRCGGDLCVCGQEDVPCPMCGGEYGGEGYVPKARADLYYARLRELQDVFRAAMDNADKIKP